MPQYAGLLKISSSSPKGAFASPGKRIPVPVSAAVAVATTFMLLMPMMPASQVATGPLAPPSLLAVTVTPVAPTFPGVKVRGPEFHTPITISAALREIDT